MTTNSDAGFDPATSNIPLYATQGDGIATFQHGQYVWHSDIPHFLGAHVGDPIPDEWSVVSINEAARREVEEAAGRFCDLVEDYLDSCFWPIARG